MNASPEISTRSGRTGRLTLLTAAPLAALALAVYAFSGAQSDADAGDAAGIATPPALGVFIAPAADPTRPEETPLLREHDTELLAYRPHGG